MAGATTTSSSHYSSLSDIVKDLHQAGGPGGGEIFDPAALLGSDFGGAFGSSKSMGRGGGAMSSGGVPPSSHSFQSSQQSLESLLGELIKHRFSERLGVQWWIRKNLGR